MSFLIHGRLFGIAAAVAVGSLAACADGAGPGSAELTVVLRRGSAGPTLSETGLPAGIRTPSAAVAATPLACPFQAAAVRIEEIYLQGDGGHTTLRSSPATVELCDLGSQALLLIQDVEVPAGSYGEIRFVIGGGYVQDPVDGSVYATAGYDLPSELAPADGTLQTPSWDASGLKVDFADGPLTVEGARKVIALDIDVAQSFGKLAGSSSQWVMAPVIKAADISFTGSVEVQLQLGPGVTLPEVNGQPVTFGDFDATATLAATEVTQAFDPVLGTTVLFLSPNSGPYTITLGIPATVEATSAPASHPVTIAEGTPAAPVTFTLNQLSVPAGAVNRPPVAEFGTPARPSFNATVGVPVRFDPVGTYDPEGPWGGTWNFGDGESFTGTFANYPSHVVEHSYAAPGNYTVTWTIHDEQGATDVATTTAVVSAP